MVVSLIVFVLFGFKMKTWLSQQHYYHSTKLNSKLMRTIHPFRTRQCDFYLYTPKMSSLHSSISCSASLISVHFAFCVFNSHRFQSFQHFRRARPKFSIFIPFARWTSTLRALSTIYPVYTPCKTWGGGASRRLDATSTCHPRRKFAVINFAHIFDFHPLPSGHARHFPLRINFLTISQNFHRFIIFFINIHAACTRGTRF